MILIASVLSRCARSFFIVRMSGCSQPIRFVFLAIAVGFTQWPEQSDAQHNEIYVDKVPPVRGVWVANVGSTALGSPEQIRDFVELAHACKLNTLYVVVWNRGMTTYPSRIMQERFGIACDPRYSEFDALQEVIQAAHQRGMRVVAWFEFGFSCSYQQPSGGRIIKKYPHWAAQDRAGNLATKNGFQWMNAFHPEVQDFVLALLKEILQEYDVDGVQGDDRLPACPSTAGYDAWTTQLYQDQHDGQLPPHDHRAQG